MPIITSTDLATRLYPEVIAEISRGDDSIIDTAIAAAIQETKMYLAKFDLMQLFGDDSTPPSVTDEYLKSLVKDIACWQLLKLSNPNADMSNYRKAYDESVQALKDIMSGQTQPSGWPYADKSDESTPKGDAVAWTSNEKRNNYY